MNLETWRQLWRTVEICDIVLMIVDVRFAVSDQSFLSRINYHSPIGSTFLSYTLRLCHSCSQETTDRYS